MDKQRNIKGNQMKVSVIVPNHGRDISILKSSLPKDVELLEIDLGLERSIQRNIGMLRATGDAYLILDSDQSIEEGLIEECTRLCGHGFSCIYIPEVLVVKSFFGKIRKFEREFYTGTAIDVPRFVLANACGFFDEDLSGPEDSDWDRKLQGFRAISRKCLYHHDNIGILQYFRKKAYYARSLRAFSRKWPDDKCLNFKYRCWTVFTEKGKWKKLVRHPFLSLGIFFIILIRGIIYVTNK